MHGGLVNIKTGYCLDDVLLIPKYSEIESRNLVDVSVDLGKGINLNIPICPSNMKDICDLEMALAMASMGGLALLHRFRTEFDGDRTIKDTYKIGMQTLGETWRSHVGGSIGVQENDKITAEELIELGCKILCIDVAHADSTICLRMVEYIAKKYPEVLLIAGTVGTGKGAKRVNDAGADVIRVNLGNGCFAAGTRILLSNGTCKNIEKIVPGDRIINKNGKPVTVKNVVMTGIKKVVKLKHDLAHKETFVTPDHQYWVGDCNNRTARFWKAGCITKSLDKLTPTKESKYKWKSIKDTNQDCLLIPRNIQWELKKDFSINIEKREGGNRPENIIKQTEYILKPNYDLGYIFGTFLGDGHAFIGEYKKSKRGNVRWYFGLEEKDIAEKLQLCIKKIFDKDLVIEKKKSILDCCLYYKPLADFLKTFGKKHNKHLPSQFIVDNKEYLTGLFDGLIDSDGSIESPGSSSPVPRKKLGNTSEKIIELCSIISNIINGTFNSGFRTNPTAGTLKNCNIENCRDGYVASINPGQHKKLTKNYQVSRIRNIEEQRIEIPVYDLEVDCETHSFVANFAIVHNSICTTRLETGNGVPQLSALEDCYMYSFDRFATIKDIVENPALTPEEFDIEVDKALTKPYGKRKFKVIADGGCKRSGDVVKSLCFSDLVMTGNMLAGTAETPGEIIEIDGITYKNYRGSSTHKKSNVEGVKGLVRYKGPVKEIIEKILQGVRSGCSYQNAKNLEELRKDPQFTLITNAGLIESHAHNLDKIIG